MQVNQMSFMFQVKQRADECIRALDILFDINSGKSVENILQSNFDLSTMEVNITMSYSWEQRKNKLLDLIPQYFFSIVL